MTKSLEQLKKERNLLLRKANAKNSLQALSIQREVERRKVKAEITALRHPGSVVAKRTAKRIAIKSGRALFRGVFAIGKHLSEVAAEQNRPERKRRVTKKRKKKRR